MPSFVAKTQCDYVFLRGMFILGCVGGRNSLSYTRPVQAYVYVCEVSGRERRSVSVFVKSVCLDVHVSFRVVFKEH